MGQNCIFPSAIPSAKPSVPDLRALLARLEVPPCNCPVAWVESEDGPTLLPCAHVRAALDHGLSLAEWAELLAAGDPKEYADRPPADEPTRTVSQAARVRVYARRVRAGRAIWHPGDLPTDTAHIVRTSGDLRSNGTRVRSTVRVRAEKEREQDHAKESA